MNGLGCVVDAGVLVACCVAEESGGPSGGENALRLLERAARRQIALYTPELALAESGSVLWKYVRLRGYPAGAAERAVRALTRMPLQLATHAPLLPQAFDLSLRYGVTVYDALYVALAARERLPFVTTDARLVRAVSPSLPAVTLLEDLS